MGLIRNAVEQGRQASVAIKKEGRARRRLDAIVVGAGPSGTAAALGCEAYGLRTLVVDQTAWGGTIVHYPRAKVVMTGSFELPGYGTVRKRTMSKEDLVELWNDIRARTQLHIEEGVRVESIVADGNLWRVRRRERLDATRGERRARARPARRAEPARRARRGDVARRVPAARTRSLFAASAC